MKKNTCLGLTASIIIATAASGLADTGDPNLISIDVVSSTSVPVSGSVTGGLTGQVGPWNSLAATGGAKTLTGLKDGTGAATGVGFVLGSSYSLQMGSNPSVTGVVLAANNPERAWITGATTLAFKFTGLTAGGSYDLAIFNTGSPKTILTVNGTPHTGVGTIFTTIEFADANGEILGVASFNGAAHSDYTELSGFQLYKRAVAPPLMADAGADKTVTPSLPSVVIGASLAATGGTPPYTYSWSPTTGLDDASLANPTAVPTATTTYTLTVTDSASSTPAIATDEVVVTYTAPPLVASAGADKTVTPSLPSVVIGASLAATGGTPPYTYSWSPTTGLDDASLANPTAAPTATTTYILTVTDSASPIPATATDEVEVTYTVPLLVADAGADKTATPSLPAVVIGASLAATGGTPPYTYSWSPTTGLDDASLANPTAAPTATTIYTLTVTDSASPTPAIATDEVEVTYTVPPLVANAGPDKTVFAGSPSVAIGGSPTASGGSASYIYSWSPTESLDDPSAANPTASPTITTTYTVTVTDSLGTPLATDEITVTYIVPNMNLISVDFRQGSGTTCEGDTTLTGTTMKNAVGNGFTGQAGNWNAMNIGTYNQNSALSGFLNNGGGAATTVKLALGRATGLDNAAAGGWRCSPNEGALGGPDRLRSESAYLYSGVITGDHYAWALTGLVPDSTYKLTFFGDLGNASGASNFANSVAGTRDSEGDWNWETITTDSSGTILGTFTAPNPTLGLYGLQIEAIGGPDPSAYDTWAQASITAIDPGADATATGDPDHDGATNLAEFAFHGNPLSGSDNGYHLSATEDTDTDTLKELTLTLAVRNGEGSPIFTGSPSLSASVDGITYTIEGSLDLAFPNSAVSETSAPTGLPVLPAGWEYRRFRLNASNDLLGKGFLRAKVAKP